MTDSFVSIAQLITEAEPGTQLTDIVSFTVDLEGDTTLTGDAPLGNYVDLFDLVTGKVVASHYYYPTLFPQTIKDSLPLATDSPVKMPSTPFYLELRVSRGTFVVDVPTYVVDATKMLQPIGLPGQGPPPPLGGGNAALVVAGVVGVGLAAAGIYLLTKKKK